MDWHRAYADGHTPWDLLQPTPPLEHLLRSGRLAELGVPTDGRIAVPGCGRGHDVRALARAGYRVTGFDVVPAVVDEARQLLTINGVDPERAEILTRDVLGLDPDFDGAFDLVYDYTCFCALAPHLRAAYGGAVARLLRPGAIWLGLVFPMAPGGYVERPPFRIEAGAVAAALGGAFAPVASFPAVASVPERSGLESWAVFRRLGGNEPAESR